MPDAQRRGAEQPQAALVLMAHRAVDHRLGHQRNRHGGNEAQQRDGDHRDPAHPVGHQIGQQPPQIRAGAPAGRRRRYRRRRALRTHIQFSQSTSNYPLSGKSISVAPRLSRRYDIVGVRLAAELGLVELGVAPAAGQQLIVGAAFDDAAVLDDEDRVGRPDRGQPVGDDDRRSGPPAPRPAPAAPRPPTPSPATRWPRRAPRPGSGRAAGGRWSAAGAARRRAGSRAPRPRCRGRRASRRRRRPAGRGPAHAHSSSSVASGRGQPQVRRGSTRGTGARPG